MMIEEYRNKAKKKQQIKILQLPSIKETRKNNQGIIVSENTLKLCRVGARKSKFINFELKNPIQYQNSSMVRSKLSIPMLSYKQNKFGYLKQQKHKHEHSLLISRVKQHNTVPSIGDYDTSNYQKIKFKQSKNCIFPIFEKNRYSIQSKSIR